MQYTVNRGEKGKIEVKVSVPKADFSASYNEVLSQFQKEAKISGFRPGKAPSGVVEQHVGLNRLLNETAGFLVSKHLGQILKKEELSPVDSPRIAVDTLVKDSPFDFTATFTQKPKVKVGNWKAIKVKKLKARDVTDEDVNQSVKNIFEAWKKQKEGKEGPQETGKFIYDAHGNKIPIKDKEETSISEPNEEFAEAVGAKDLNHLKEVIKKDLEALVASQAEAQFEDELFTKLLAIGEVEVPEILVEDELNRILLRLSSQLQQKGLNLEKYLEEEKTTVDGLKTKWREQAEKNVETTLILDAIGKAEKVAVSREEVDAALKSISTTELSAEQKADLERYVLVSIFQAKTLDLIKKTVIAS